MTEDQIREIEQDVFRAAIDYGKSPAPSFDAVEDIKNYLGDRYDKMAEIMKSLHRSDFEAGCERSRQPLPVQQRSWSATRPRLTLAVILA